MEKLRFFGPSIASFVTRNAAQAFNSTRNSLLMPTTSAISHQQLKFKQPSSGSSHRKRLRDLFPKEALSPSAAHEGVSGERELIISDPNSPEAMQAQEEAMNDLQRMEDAKLFPDLDTFQHKFYDMRFDEIPICKIKCSKNNTKITFKTAKGSDVCYTSSSQEGFRNSKKKSLVAGQATGLAGALRALRRGVKTVRVQIMGLGPGRLSAVKGLTLGGLNVVCIQDITPLPEYGPRPKKVRRL